MDMHRCLALFLVLVIASACHRNEPLGQAVARWAIANADRLE